MPSPTNLLQSLDESVTRIFSQWNIYTTIIAVTIFSFLAYHILTSRDPDAHPMLLARQAQASAVRNPGESATYRSHASSHGMPLISGLQVKDPGTFKWSRGRDGDLRDIWRKAVMRPAGERGSLYTVLGSKKLVEHNPDEITQQINIIGQYIQRNGGSRVAIYLPNSLEFLIAIFACSFYNLTPVLLPYSQKPNDALAKVLSGLEIDTLIAAAGSVASVHECPTLREFIGVVDEGNEHMAWGEKAEQGAKLKSSTWQEIVSDGKSSSSTELPDSNLDAPKDVIAFRDGLSTTYSHANLVAAIAGQLSALPSAQRITNADLFFPADSLSKPYPLILTLAALFSHASIALNSVAGEAVDIELATQGIAPTIIVAGKASMTRLHERATDRLSPLPHRLAHRVQSRALTDNGVMPAAASLIARLNDRLRPALGAAPGTLRLIFVAEEAGAAQNPINTTALNDLRVVTGARIIYALTARPVAGPISQTGLYDYRVGSRRSDAHFGAPLTCVEIVLRDTKDHKTTDDLPLGEIIVRGPAVVGGEAALGVIGTFRPDACLAYPPVSPPWA